ncbi:outer membrane beta-barrel protein [Candidatus Borreliella tachyglossi]|uniref:outer membrane beta-barrel protein n=1 Tax=Candidatus Borreliella tachyglossi TaxID=1964448 RepID=UPI004041841B
MKRYIFLFFLFLVSNDLVFSYPLFFGGGLSYQFTNYTGKSDINEFKHNSNRVDNGINLNLFFDANYVIFDMSYKDAFISTHNSKYFSFGLYGIYPIVFKEYVRLLFPLLGAKYTIDLSPEKGNLFFISLGLAADLFIPEVKGLYLRPLLMLSISPTSAFVGNFSSLTTEITLGINIGWKFID